MGTLQSRWYNGTTELPLYVWAGDRSGVFYSDDGGDTWQLGGMVNSRIGASECQVAETDEGLFISFRVEDKDSGCRKMAFSRDGGQSFEDFFEPQVGHGSRARCAARCPCAPPRCPDLRSRAARPGGPPSFPG